METFSQLIWCLTNFSTKFRRLFHNLNGSASIFTCISNKLFLENLLCSNNIFDEEDIDEENCTLINAIIGSLHNLSKSVKFDDNLNASKNLILVTHKIQEQNSQANIMQIYMTLANILTDKEIDEMADTVMQSVNKLVALIGKVLN